MWAQLTNPRDQLSHQIGYLFFFFFFACPSHQIGYPFSFSFFACHFFPLSFTMSQQRVCNLIRLIFPAESRRAQKQLQPVSTGYNDWKENVQRPLSEIPKKEANFFPQNSFAGFYLDHLCHLEGNHHFSSFHRIKLEKESPTLTWVAES